MLKIDKIDVSGWEAAIRGMRNPMNSWAWSDSRVKEIYGFVVGETDLRLMRKLAKAGGPHAKYRRMIVVTCDILAPLYWWKEFDTYKVGTVVNSCSTMHKIHSRDLTLDDFSCERLDPFALQILRLAVKNINTNRGLFVSTGNKQYWDNMIQLLPSSYNQLRTVMMNYEVLAGIYKYRKDHKLDEWHTLCDAIRQLPHSELITGEGL